MTVIANRQGGAAVEQREDLVTLTIDDIEVSVPKGTGLVEAALANRLHESRTAARSTSAVSGPARSYSERQRMTLPPPASSRVRVER